MTRSVEEPGLYGKATETAIAAMTRLAEAYDGGKSRLSAAEIAESRSLQRPFVGKILTALARSGLVTGSRGPGGGFSLARHPRKIRIYDVFKLFERENRSDICPFGGGLCGAGEPCPLHDKLVGVQQAIDRVLHETTFDDFRRAYHEHGGRSAIPKTTRPGKRESFRAPSTPRKRA